MSREESREDGIQDMKHAGRRHSNLRHSKLTWPILSFGVHPITLFFSSLVFNTVATTLKQQIAT
jgi:hypothetical protein